MLAFRSCGAKYNGSRCLSSVVSWASREEELANMCDSRATSRARQGSRDTRAIDHIRYLVLQTCAKQHRTGAKNQLWSQSKSMVVTAASVSCLGYCP